MSEKRGESNEAVGRGPRARRKVGEQRVMSCFLDLTYVWFRDTLTVRR